MRTTTVLRGYRRTIVSSGIAVAAFGCTLALTSGTSAGSPSAPAAAIEPGKGVAIAQTYKVDPKAGGLSIGATLGISIAGHTNTVAQASSQAINLGVIGTTLAGEGCDGGDPTLASEDQPQPLSVDSREEGAAEGKSETEDGVFTKSARASNVPFGEAITKTSGFGIPGVGEIGGGTATSYSGLTTVDGQQVREARAITTISSIDLAGLVHLEGLRWEAVWRSAGSKVVNGSFEIGAAKIGATKIPTNDPAQTLKQVNTALATLGLQIVVPEKREAGGVVFVDPFAISVVPNTARDTLTGGVLNAVQPIRKSLFDALLDFDCGNATYITVFDVVLGSVTGAGSFSLALGGVQASSGLVPASDYDLAGGFGGGLGPAVPDLGADTPTDTGVDLGGDTTDTTTASDEGGDGGALDPIAPVASILPAGERGGVLLGVGLGTLGLLAAIAEGDRRKMRRAQREIPIYT